MKRRINVIAILFTLLLTVPTMAQSTDKPVDTSTPIITTGDITIAPATEPKAIIKADSSEEPPETTPGEIIDQIQKISDDWGQLGWMGGVIAVIGLLILMLRFKPIDTFLGNNNIKWIKPFIALGLGMSAGFFTALLGGAIWYQAIIAGLIAGLAAPGAHQILTGGNR